MNNQDIIEITAIFPPRMSSHTELIIEGSLFNPRCEIVAGKGKLEGMEHGMEFYFFLLILLLGEKNPENYCKQPEYYINILLYWFIAF